MIIRRPLKSNHITQIFGANHITYYKEVGMLGHNGYDLRAWDIEPVYHSGDFEGRAETHIDINGGIGLDVIGENYKLRYWHLKRFAKGMENDKMIQPGDLIGYADNTGVSTGTHLHFGLKEVDSSGNTRNKGNGYYGGIDLAPYWKNEFIIDYLAERDLEGQVKEEVLSFKNYMSKGTFEVGQFLKKLFYIKRLIDKIK